MSRKKREPKRINAAILGRETRVKCSQPGMNSFQRMKRFSFFLSLFFGGWRITSGKINFPFGGDQEEKIPLLLLFVEGADQLERERKGGRDNIHLHIVRQVSPTKLKKKKKEDLGTRKKKWRRWRCPKQSKEMINKGPRKTTTHRCLMLFQRSSFSSSSSLLF